jgi:hypothetical protein
VSVLETREGNMRLMRGVCRETIGLHTCECILEYLGRRRLMLAENRRSEERQVSTSEIVPLLLLRDSFLRTRQSLPSSTPPSLVPKNDRTNSGTQPTKNRIPNRLSELNNSSTKSVPPPSLFLSNLSPQIFATDTNDFISLTAHSGTIAAFFQVIDHLPFPVQPGGIVPVLVRAIG